MPLLKKTRVLFFPDNWFTFLLSFFKVYACPKHRMLNFLKKLSRLFVLVRVGTTLLMVTKKDIEGGGAMQASLTLNCLFKKTLLCVKFVLVCAIIFFRLYSLAPSQIDRRNKFLRCSFKLNFFKKIESIFYFQRFYIIQNKLHVVFSHWTISYHYHRNII